MPSPAELFESICVELARTENEIKLPAVIKGHPKTIREFQNIWHTKDKTRTRSVIKMKMPILVRDNNMQYGLLYTDTVDNAVKAGWIE